MGTVLRNFVSVTPLVGITGRNSLGSTVAPGISHLADSPVDWFFAEYSLRVREAGGLPVELPVIDSPRDYVERLDALVLTGGGDIAPKRWNGPVDLSFMVSEERDAFEFGLLEAAVDWGIPVLGICRGLQLINVFFGGTLVPHLDASEGDEHSKLTVDRAEERHPIACIPGTILFELYGPTGMVNSFHHQAVDQLGSGLRASAYSPDGTVEGIEDGSGRVVGVQWHPEMLKNSQPVFAWVTEMANQR